MQMLPDKIAVMVGPQRKGLIELPDAVDWKGARMRRPGRSLLKGTVYAVGIRKDSRVPLPEVGDTVCVEPGEGLVIEHGDLDISLGSIVPEGHTLRMFGYGDDWVNSVPVTMD